MKICKECVHCYYLSSKKERLNTVLIENKPCCIIQKCNNRFGFKVVKLTDICENFKFR